MSFNKGYVFKDGQAIPDDDLKGRPAASDLSSNPTTPIAHKSTVDTRQTSTTSSSTMNTPTSSTSTFNGGSAPTESHALANADHDIKGAAQVDHDEIEVKDLGWNEHPKDTKNLVGGLRNDDLWLLVRRFNKQMYHVKATNIPQPGGLDLNIADEDEFSPDKLRSNLERLYMTVIIGLIGFGKHIARLRSWREPRRTAAFASAYFIAWVLNLIVPLMFSTVVVLIVYPPSRNIMFPPAPIALVDSKTGGVQSPKAGVLGSHDSVTGAPEKHKGEAVEQEANNFVSGVASIALSSATGKHEQGDPESDPLDATVPDPTNMATVGSEAQGSTNGALAHHDKTKQPMEDAMWTKMRPTMHIIGDVADGWERFANALSPTSPYPKEAPRLKLAGLLVPAVAISLLTSSAMFVKMTMFFIGFGFFGDPINTRALKFLNQKFPHWQKLLEIRNTILKGVPTNAQLTITLLRVGEANKAPLPPPPTSDQPPPDHPAELDKHELQLDASHDEIHDAITADSTEDTSGDAQANKPAKHHHGSRILGVFKGTTKAGVETKLGVDQLRAVAGSSHAKNHLGILPKPSEQTISGPIDFRARYKGTKGWIYISTSATTPCVAFSTHAKKGSQSMTDETLKAVFTIPIEDIKELKKKGGLGWKAKIVVGWATDRNVADGLEIVDKTGTIFRLTAITLREELFNRLVAMGGQKWESY
ncbi:hypothetical protein MMC09_000447 [Bachmanniomyces sp. S44760]|nr:hypothetical protein [Bachmanniomyces sp. S44760]